MSNIVINLQDEKKMAEYGISKKVTKGKQKGNKR